VEGIARLARGGSEKADSLTSIDPERDEHLLEIGRAITGWAAIQDELYSIVRTVRGCAPQHASIVFYRTPSIEARITLTDDLLKTIFPQPSEKPGSKAHPGYATWADIQKELREEVPIRNRLAHHPVRFVIDDCDHEDRGVFSGLRPATVMSRFEALRKVEGSPLSVKDIMAHTARVEAFAPRLLAFRSGPLATQIFRPGRA
jgi:hypothetical protein